MTKTFGFEFDVSNEFIRLSPVADQYIEAAKARIAAQKLATGPRGGLYRLVSPPDKWRTSQDAFFERNLTVFATRREGRYVRPDRITADLVIGDTVHFATLTTPVVEGLAVLPDGRTVETESQAVSFPVIVP